MRFTFFYLLIPIFWVSDQIKNYKLNPICRLVIDQTTNDMVHRVQTRISLILFFSMAYSEISVKSIFMVFYFFYKFLHYLCNKIFPIKGGHERLGDYYDIFKFSFIFYNTKIL